MNDPKGILDEVKKAVVGKDGVLVMALLAILAGGHILLEDIPGVGKTTMALAFSKALSLKYNRARQSAITQEITEIVAGAEH